MTRLKIGPMEGPGPKSITWPGGYKQETDPGYNFLVNNRTILIRSLITVVLISVMISPALSFIHPR